MEIWIACSRCMIEIEKRTQGIQRIDFERKFLLLWKNAIKSTSSNVTYIALFQYAHWPRSSVLFWSVKKPKYESSQSIVSCFEPNYDLRAHIVATLQTGIYVADGNFSPIAGKPPSACFKLLLEKLDKINALFPSKHQNEIIFLKQSVKCDQRSRLLPDCLPNAEWIRSRDNIKSSNFLTTVKWEIFLFRNPTGPWPHFVDYCFARGVSHKT